MKNTFSHTLHLLKYNFKTLFYFELIYRALGVLIVFPLVQFLFNTSIKLSGYTYITNSLLVDYLTDPYTILSLLVLVIVLSFYMMIEMIVMTLIFDHGAKEEPLGLKDLMIKGAKRIYIVLKRYHVRIFFPALFFFLLVELLHVVGIAQTINIPDELLAVINRNVWFQVGVIVLIIGIFAFFIETIFSINFYAVDKMTPKEARLASKHLLKGKRLEMSFEFMITNVILNLILYAFYAVLVFIVGFAVSVTRGEPYALSVILNIFYSIYGLVGFLATITLIPINFALMTSWYDERRQSDAFLQSIPTRKIKMKPFKNERTLKWVLLGVGLFLFITNLVAVLNVTQAQSQLEVLNYAEIIAHRGQSGEAPENTLAAIELAISNGADAVEVDVRQSLDHIPVLIHDSTTKRTTNDTSIRYVNQLSVNELKQLDAGSWFSEDYAGEQIPTLEDALKIMTGRTRLFLELKDQNEQFETYIVNLLVIYEMIDQTVILSFSNQQLTRIKAINPNVQTLLLIHSFFGRYEDLVNAPYADNFGLSLTFYQNNESLIDVIHQKGKKVYIWTVNDETSLRKIVESDVDGIITDVPNLAREISYTKNAPEFLVQVLRRFFKKNEQGLN